MKISIIDIWIQSPKSTITYADIDDLPTGQYDEIMIHDIPEDKIMEYQCDTKQLFDDIAMRSRMTRVAVYDHWASQGDEYFCVSYRSQLKSMMQRVAGYAVLQAKEAIAEAVEKI